jgi:signal transduction histidine kinase
MSVRRRLSRLVELIPRPLDFVKSIKLKLGLVVIGSGAACVAVFWQSVGHFRPETWIVAMIVATVAAQVLAHGMTRPLREMTAAARAMARGDYTRRVRATARDEVGQLAVAFNQMAADLQAADRQRRELIANVSHELRTPIFALQAVLENAVDGIDADPATLSAALAQTERLGRLVTELLDLSRIEAGVVPLAKESFDVAAFMQAAVREAEINAAAAGRQVTFVASAASSPAHADPHRLHQVVANLLDNAARHSPRGGVVTAAAHRHGADLVLEVTDDGDGIPEADRRHVFERFTRGGSTGRRDPGGGTGLGLAIAHWVVELHGGSIEVVDIPGERPGPAGCRIQVRLPAAL